ncbi:MAG: cbb3-type cytochrome c oxidase subunit I [Acidimicrobiales bacterium]
MTMTDSPPATDIAHADSAAAVASPVAGLYEALTSTDHKIIGRLWLRAGVLMLIGAVALGVLLGFERVDGASTDIFGGDNAYFQVWALYRIGLALLVAAPLFIGLAMVVAPMQVGSTNIAFPRAALASAWGFMIGAVIMIVAVLAGGGWGAVDQASGDERDAVALTLVGMAMVVISLLLGALCVATTVVSMRVKGMTLLRAPLFAWSMLVASAVWLLTLPVLLANLLIAYVDLHNGPGTFGGGLSGDLSIYGQVDWLVQQPQVYAFAIPVLGVLGSIVPVTAGVRAGRHGLSMGLIGFFGLLSVGAWAQPYFQPTSDAVVRYDEKFVYIAFGIAAILPVLGALGGAADALFRGRNNFAGLPPAHVLGALGAGLLLLVGTAAGVARVVEPFELGDRVTTSGVMNLVLFSAIAAAVAGMWFWAPKIGGSELPPMMGRLVAVSLIGGGLLLGGAQVVNGFFETSVVPLVAPTDDVGDALNVVSLLGMLLIAVGVLGLVAALGKALRSTETAADDPWGGHTLEWATATPPPPGNFAEAPALVTSEAPLLDAPTDEGGEP